MTRKPDETLKPSAHIDMRTLPRLASWADADPQLTPFAWLCAEASVDMAVAFTTLFWPDLVEHEGGVFLREFFSRDAWEQWRERLGHDTAAIERVMNHRHLADLLPGGDVIGFSNLQHLGQILAATWRARLERAFPERQFLVTCTDAPEDEEVVLTFCRSQPLDQNRS